MSKEQPIVQSLTHLLEQLPMEAEERRVALALRRDLRKFLKLAEIENSPAAEKFLNWSADSGKPLFNEVGKLVRTFTDQLKVIRSDIPQRLGEMAQHDMVSATQRLELIVEMTETAANKTMDLAENMSGELKAHTKLDKEALMRIDALTARGKLSAEAADTLEALRAVLQARYESDEHMQSILTEMLIAQDYQDLTGQVIHKIVDLLGNLENELLSLVETFGQVYMPKDVSVKDANLKGPQHEKDDSRQSQTNVDDLLDSLGF